MPQKFWSQGHQSAQEPPKLQCSLRITNDVIQQYANVIRLASTAQRTLNLDFLHPHTRRGFPSIAYPVEFRSQYLIKPTRSRNNQKHAFATNSTRFQESESTPGKIGSTEDLGSILHLWSQQDNRWIEDGDTIFGKTLRDDSLKNSDLDTPEDYRRSENGWSSNVDDRYRSLISAVKAIAEFDTTHHDIRDASMCHIAASCAVDLEDDILANRIVDASATTPYILQTMAPIFEFYVANDRFEDAASLIADVNKHLHPDAVFDNQSSGTQIYHRSLIEKLSADAFRKNLRFTMKHPGQISDRIKKKYILSLPKKAISVVRSLPDVAPYRDSENMRDLAIFLLHTILRQRILGRGLTPKGFLKLIEEYDDAGVLDPVDIALAIRARGADAARNRWEIAVMLYRILRHRFPTYTVETRTFGSLLSVMANSQTAKPSDFRFILDEFASVHGMPDERAYQLSLTACAKAGDARAVEEIFAEFQKSYGKTRDLAFLNPLVYVHAITGNIREARMKFDWITIDLGVQADKALWNTLLYAFARADNLEGAVEIFNKMKAANFKPDQFTYGTVMSICAQAGDLESVLHIAADAEQADIPLTNHMLDTIVRAYCRNGEPERAEEVVEAAVRMQSPEQTVRLWNSLLIHHSLHANTSKLLRIQERMKELDIRPDAGAYAAWMLSLTKVGKSEDALRILRALHLDQQTTLSATHYAIVMNGYAKEGNRDQVTRLYSELLERPGGPDISTDYAVLVSLTRRDLHNQGLAMRSVLLDPHSHVLSDTKGAVARYELSTELPHAKDFLDRILQSLDITKLATKYILPGVGKLDARHIVPIKLFRFMVRVFGKSKAEARVSELFGKYKEAVKKLRPHANLEVEGPLALQAEKMYLHAGRGEHHKVQDIWDELVIEAIRSGRTRKHIMQKLDLDVHHQMVHTNVSEGSAQDSAAQNESHSSSTAEVPSDPLLEPGLKVMHSHRFDLSRPLTNYMHSLARQNLYERLPPLIANMQRVGFALDSKNWNSYIQLMASSPEPHHQFLAFTTFEEKLLPTMPPWAVLIRGKAIRRNRNPQDGPRELGKVQFLENIDPDALYPHYRTLVFLGAALVRFRQRSANDEGTELHRLLQTAMKSVAVVTQMPYRKDRIQGHLLRGRDVRGDLVRISEEPRHRSRHGLLTPAIATFEDLSPDDMEAFNELRKMLPENLGKLQDSSARLEIKSCVRNFFGVGDFQKSEPSGDSEADKIAITTPQALTNISLETMEEIIRNARAPSMIANEEIGDPAYDATKIIQHWREEALPDEKPSQELADFKKHLRKVWKKGRKRRTRLRPKRQDLFGILNQEWVRPQIGRATKKSFSRKKGYLNLLKSARTRNR